MKVDISGSIKRFSGAMIQPITFMAVAGIILAAGVLLKMEMMPAPLIAVGTFVYDIIMNAFIGNLGAIFCVGLTVALAQKKKGDAAVIGLVSYLTFLYANNAWLTNSGMLVEAESLTGTGQGMVFGLQVVDMGVFLGIGLGCITGWVYNKLADVQFPDAVRIYGGTRLAFAACVATSSLLAIAMCYVWPLANNLIVALQGLIAATGNIGLFIYGFLNRILIPTGLHHLVYMPFWYTSVGGTLELAGEVYTGSTPIWYAQLGSISEITAIDPSIMYDLTGFSKMFGSIGAILAFIATARPENKASVRAMLLPIGFVAVFAGVTEPLEFSFLFIAPILFVVHAVLDGLFQVIVFMAGLRMPLGTLVTLFTSVVAAPAELTHWWVIIPTGIVGIIVWFLVFRFFILKLNLKTPGREDAPIELPVMEAAGKAVAAPSALASATIEGMGDVDDIIAGLGGADNIVSIINCITRLRVDVRSMDLVDDATINRFKNSGIVRGTSNVQIIIGMKVPEVCDAVRERLGLVEE